MVAESRLSLKTVGRMGETDCVMREVFCFLVVNIL